MKKGRITKYHIFLIVAFLAVWTWAAINPIYPHDWLLENYLVFIFIPIIILSGIYFRLSKLSYTLITLFLILHVIGSHYTYAEVPFGDVIKQWFNADRNMYDRLVHFCFGLLIAYPVREVFIRITRAKGLWGYYLPIELTMAFSMIYELIEWLTALAVNPEAGLAFLGSQGDVWDAQKDMAMATLGSIVSMFIIFMINLFLNKSFWSELKNSFKIPKDDEPLGEVKLEQMIKEKYHSKSTKH
ncbi:MAG: DUF2238 domain-containing protein [Nanoarchaeota archaeon]